MLSRILIAVAAACLTCGVAAAEAPRTCTEGEPEPSISEQLRPTQTAVCAYDATVLNRRVRSLLRVGSRAWSVEVVERIFGLPEMYTAYDGAWNATYLILLSAGSGNGDWRIMLNFSEGFWPQGGSHPPRYRGSRRPVRINPRDRPEMRLTIDWLAPRDIAPGTEACLDATALNREARQRGWRVGEELQTIMDAGARWRTEITRGDARIDLAVPRDQPCVTQFNLSVDP